MSQFTKWFKRKRGGKNLKQTNKTPERRRRREKKLNFSQNQQELSPKDNLVVNRVMKQTIKFAATGKCLNFIS